MRLEENKENTNTGKEKLGENIVKVKSESEELNILKFTDKLAVYLFNYESRILEIILKENVNIAGYGKAILIKEFVNGDFGIKLPTTTPILFGSRFDRERGTEDIQYVFNENTFVPKGGFKDSNGAGTIKIKNKTIGTGKLELLKDYPKKRKTDNVYKDQFGNIIIHDILRNWLILKAKDLDMKIIIEDYITGDYKINIKNPIYRLSGSKLGEGYIVKKGEDLFSIAKEKYGDEKKWKTITKDNRKTFTEEEAKRLKAGQRIFFKLEEERKLTFENTIEI